MKSPLLVIILLHDANTPTGQVRGSNGRNMVRPGILPLFVLILVVLLLLAKIRCVFSGLLTLELVFWSARHPNPGRPSGPLGISFEFVNVGCWLSEDGLALDSQVHFPATVEHRRIPAGARNVTAQLRQAGVSSVWALHVKTLHLERRAGVGVVILHGAPLSLPSIVTHFTEIFRLGRAMRVVLRVGSEGAAHLFVIHGYRGADGDPENLALTDHLLTSVFAEAKMCCSGQPVIPVRRLECGPFGYSFNSQRRLGWCMDRCGEGVCHWER